MGIYLPNMEMPTGNDELRLIIRSNRQVIISHETYFDETEAIPVSPHGDLIDANKLVELCDIMADKCDGIGVSVWHQFKTTVEWSPIVIPAEEE